jgi:signal-transduction protein with cAMP-binding, CBS, and nucleotidyltransferase domain
LDIKLELNEPITKYMAKDVCRVSAFDTVADAAKKMKNGGVAEALVFGRGEPTGIITERDILYKVVATGADPKKTAVSRIMSSPVETIQDTAKTGDAVAKMSKLGVRRLVVVKGNEVVGMVIQRSIIAGSVQEQVPLPELTSPKGVRCPYCDELFTDADQLSKHIDQVHIGRGLLQGNLSKW